MQSQILEHFYEILIIDLVLIWGRPYRSDNGQLVYISLIVVRKANIRPSETFTILLIDPTVISNFTQVMSN